MPNVAPAIQVPRPSNGQYNFGDLYWKPTDLTDPVNGYGDWLGAANMINLVPSLGEVPYKNETFGLEDEDAIDLGANPMLFVRLIEHAAINYEIGFHGHHVAGINYKITSRNTVGKKRGELKSGKLLYLPNNRDDHNCILFYKARPSLDSAARLVKALQDPTILPVTFNSLRDEYGNVMEEALLADLVIEPLVISVVSSGTPGANSATITWTTDRAATSQVRYGLTSAYGLKEPSDRDIENGATTTSHSVVLTGLTATTTYDYSVKSVDPNGNSAVSANAQFTTA